MQRVLIALAGALTLSTTPLAAQKSSARAGLCEQIANTAERTRAFDDTTPSSRAPGYIVGQVTNRVGQPLDHALIELRHGLSDTARFKGVATNAGGGFHLDSVPPGEYILAVRHLGFQRQWHALRMVGGGTDTLCIRLRPNPVDLAPVVPVRRPSSRGE